VSLRFRVHELLDGNRTDDPAGTVVRRVLVGLILLNVVAAVVDTMPEVHDALPGCLGGLELVSVAIFAGEYLLRCWSIVEHPRYRGTFGRLRWALSAGGLIDLLAVLPSLLPLGDFDLRSLRLLRLLRIARIGKLARYSLAVQTMGNVLRSKAVDLLSLLVALLVLLVVASTIMFWLEHDAQPQLFSSIPATMWWGIVTLTTIGYGDMSPVTSAGRAFGGLVAIMGIGMFALPAGLLGAAFVDELGKARRSQQTPAPGGDSPDGTPGRCPHCGQPRS
jgi:voltage-gated potassium channel